jgi:hypothetical protein
LENHMKSTITSDAATLSTTTSHHNSFSSTRTNHKVSQIPISFFFSLLSHSLRMLLLTNAIKCCCNIHSWSLFTDAFFYYINFTSFITTLLSLCNSMLSSFYVCMSVKKIYF